MKIKSVQSEFCIILDSILNIFISYIDFTSYICICKAWWLFFWDAISMSISSFKMLLRMTQSFRHTQSSNGWLFTPSADQEMRDKEISLGHIVTKVIHLIISPSQCSFFLHGPAKICQTINDYSYINSNSFMGRPENGKRSLSVHVHSSQIRHLFRIIYLRYLSPRVFCQPHRTVWNFWKSLFASIIKIFATTPNVVPSCA